MRIELIPGPGCRLTELIGDLHTTKAVKPGQTRLIVAKICLSKAELSSRHKNSLSDSLFSELENDLGHTMTRYLTVRLTYKHSGFPEVKEISDGQDGLHSHITRLQTEATFSIKRHNPKSAWSPRTSQTMDTPLSSNPVLELIETHFPAEQAREAIRRFATERPPIPIARRFQHLGGSSEETVRSASVTPKKSAAAPASTVQASPRVQKLARDKIYSSATISHPPPAADNPGEDVDPARKIWAEMRRHSRPGRARHHRTSISADHYFNFTDDCSPSRISSRQTSYGSIDGTEVGGNSPVEQERSRIMEMALRNKRSLGADTLRSIAPSVVHSVAGKKPALGTFGLGFGRTLGWGNSWW